LRRQIIERLVDELADSDEGNNNGGGGGDRKEEAVLRAAGGVQPIQFGLNGLGGFGGFGAHIKAHQARLQWTCGLQVVGDFTCAEGEGEPCPNI